MASSPPPDPGPGPEADATPPPGQVLDIRKYPNRRLYDATRSRHVTLDELYELVAAGHTVRVRDSKSGEDLTNQILLQALIERDPLKVTAVPTPLIHLLVRMNAHLIASWFDMGLTQFFEAARAAGAAGGSAPGAGAAWWPGTWPPVPGMGRPSPWPGQAARWSNPFAQAPGAGASPSAWWETLLRSVPRAATPPPAPAEAPSEAPDTDELDALRDQVAALARELERMKGARENDAE